MILKWIFLVSFKRQFGCKAIASGSDIYLTDQYEVSDSSAVKMYSSSANSWKILPSPNKTENFCCCSFMQKLFVIGGKNNCNKSDGACIFYNKQSNSWTSVAPMMEGRENAACTVFQGRIVVSGGSQNMLITSVCFMENRQVSSSKPYHVDKPISSVEAFDHHENKWTSFPSLLSRRESHTAVSICNKMFVIGGNAKNFEVFDSISKKFTHIHYEPKWVKYLRPNDIVAFGYNIYCFVRDSGQLKVHSYDVKKGLFSYKATLCLQNTVNFSCTKVPMT